MPQPTALVDTRWYQYLGKAYVFAHYNEYGQADGFDCLSADTFAWLCWSASIADASADASIAELERYNRGFRYAIA